MKVTADLSRFRAAIRHATTLTKKTSAEVVTRTARNVAFRAAQFTPAATAAAIERDLRRDGLLVKLASRNLRMRQGRFTRQEHQQEMARIKRTRKGSTRALRAGWARAIIDLGGSFRGSRLKPNGSASKGFGRKATPHSLTARIRNAIVTGDSFGRKTDAAQIASLYQALNKAVEFVTADMEIYAQKKAAETMRKLSD